MGINPGEPEDDWARFPKMDGRVLEESSECDFHTEPTRWRRIVEDVAGTNRVSLTNYFFWSSYDTDELEKRYGWLDHHIDFCVAMNQQLIDFHMPKAVLCSGFDKFTSMANKFGLHFITEQRGPNNKRLIETYSDEMRPWIVTKYWRRLSRDEKGLIRAYIASVVE
jgi:hypothetical protein